MDTISFTGAIDTSASTLATDAVLEQYARRVPDNDAWVGINLSLAWREAGSPARHDPMAWAQRSPSLLAAFSAYVFCEEGGYLPLLSVVERMTYGVFRELSGDEIDMPPDGAVVGDMMTMHITPAIAYAAWIDHQADDARGPHEVETFLSL